MQTSHASADSATGHTGRVCWCEESSQRGGGCGIYYPIQDSNPNHARLTGVHWGLSWVNGAMGTPQRAVRPRGAWVQTWGYQQYHRPDWGPWPRGTLGPSEGRCCKATGLSQRRCRFWRPGRNPVPRSTLNLPVRLITITIFVISLGVFHKDTVLSSSDMAVLTWPPFRAAKTFKIRGEQIGFMIVVSSYLFIL